MKSKIWIFDVILYSLIVYYLYQGITHIIFEHNITETVTIEVPIYNQINKDNLYDFTIEHLKSKEGFCSKPTVSCDGLLTIGYGHVIKKSENYSTLTELEATDLLKADLNRNIDFVEKHTSLKHNKSLALGCLAFNVGSGRLLKYIKEDSLLHNNNIDKILHYCNYRSLKGNLISSKALKERRKFELFIYKMYGI